MAPDDASDEPRGEGAAAGEGRVRVLGAPARRRGGVGWVVALVLVLLGGAGAALWLARGEGLGAADEVGTAVPSPDNLLGAAWSFETGVGRAPEAAWIVPDDAPAGFSFGGDGAVSGRAAAHATPGETGWARLLSADAFRVPAPGRLVEIAAHGSADGSQLLLRFEAAGRPALEVVVASGRGAISGRASCPPGYTHVRAGLGAVAEAALDDVVLRVLDESAPPPLRRGLFDLAELGAGLLVFRGDELVLQLHGPALVDAQGVRLPAAAAALPGAGALALPGGGSVALDTELVDGERGVELRSELGELPDGCRVVREVRLAGVLAAHPVGLGSAAGLETFTDDFEGVEGVDVLVLGRGSERLLLRGEQVAVSGSWRDDGTVQLLVERAAGAGSGRVVLETSFQEQRVEAAQLRAGAEVHERAGRLGAALGSAERILREFPYDEDVLAWARLTRARLQADMQRRLEALDADLEDALFLGSARRCREVMAQALAAAETFAGSEAEARFAAAAARMGERAADLLEADRARRAARLRAVRDSFAAAGGYDHVVAELDRFLSTTLAPPSAGTGAAR